MGKSKVRGKKTQDTEDIVHAHDDIPEDVPESMWKLMMSIKTDILNCVKVLDDKVSGLVKGKNELHDNVVSLERV